jgi:hypothetical protein
MHAIQERPVAVQGEIVIRPMMYLALTYDHRIVDGREAVLFLRRVKETIEIPARMLIEVWQTNSMALFLQEKLPMNRMTGKSWVKVAVFGESNEAQVLEIFFKN